MATTYKHLGPLSDFVAAADRTNRLFPIAKPGRKTRDLLRASLSFAPGPEQARAVKVGRRWTRDGVDGEEVSWSVGYGPRTEAWLLRPSGVKGKLPGIVALHDHGGFKFYGKEKIAEGLDPAPDFLKGYWRMYYGGRAFPNALAREGYAVLVHDAFLWGSRKVPFENMPEWEQSRIDAPEGHDAHPAGMAREIIRYNNSASINEHTIAKYCNVLGTSFSGIVSFEDRVAASYLASRRDVDAHRIGCIGLSGGGTRSVLMQATCDRIRAAVSVGSMCTYAGLLDHDIATHTWMLFPPAWGRHGDWPDIAAARAPSPLLVQNDLDDALYTVKGMKDAHRRIAAHYRSVGKPRNYVGEFYPGPHKFDLEMQASAFAWLKRTL